MNSFLDIVQTMTSHVSTENGAAAHASTQNPVYDLFALGGAYRNRSDEDCIRLFERALIDNQELAMKCLFYLRDVRGGAGERRFFRVCYRFLATAYPEIAKRNLQWVSGYGRWDDLIYVAFDTPLEEIAMCIIKLQLALDMQSKTPSLLAKWIPSINASNLETRRLANKLRKYLQMTCKQYRKVLSELRGRIKIIEKLMSEGRWEEIEFDKVPSKAGLKYRDAFARRDILAKKYETFAKDENTKVNAATLYPYEIAHQVFFVNYLPRNATERLMVNKYWNNQVDYLNGEPSKMMAVIDTSGSMFGRPIEVATSLGIYCAERLGGDFHNKFITYSSRPQFIELDDKMDFVDKVTSIYKRNLYDNTNLIATFKLLRKAALKCGNRDDVPETLVVISDMQIDQDMRYLGETELETERHKWETAGLKFPNLVLWNVDAKRDTFLDLSKGVSYVSGCSPMLFEQVITGKTGWDLCLDKLMSERYAQIH